MSGIRFSLRDAMCFMASGVETWQSQAGSTPASCGLVLQSGSFAFGQPLNPLEYLIKSVIKSEVEQPGQGSVRLGQPQCSQAMAVAAGIACA